MRSLVLAPILLSLAACGGGGSEPAAEDATSPLVPATRLIGEVQGTGSRSPFEGDTVTVSGVVTGDFQDGDADTLRNLGGFFITGIPDPLFETSDGIFVYDANSASVDVSVGNGVRVTGVVVEHFGETQLHPTSVTITGTGSIAPATLFNTTGTTTNSDGDAIPDFERVEGMLVRFTNEMTVNSVHDIERFGEISLASDGRVMQFTNTSLPSVQGFENHRNDVARRSILLDDGRRGSGDRPAIYVDPDAPVRVGDTVNGLTGVMRYSRGSGGSGTESYRLMPTDTVVFNAANPRPAAPNPGGTLRVASLNVLNFFTTPDTGADNCGPSGASACRGADSATELDRQRDKLVATLLGMNADIVGLVELENNASESLASLVSAVNAAGGDYTFIDTGTIGLDAIKVGLIYRSDAVTPVGDFAVLDQSVDARFNDDKNRPVLAQTFEDAAGGRLTVAINHLKSKGSDCNDLGDPDRGDGQGNCNLTRTNAAAAMADWLNADPTGSGDPDYLILGDLNAYLKEDPVKAIVDRGFVNLVESRQGSLPYSFVFRGQSGALDHAFASGSLDAQVSGAVDWHINADEARVFDYNLEHNREPSWFDGSEPYRSSDHDPVIVGIQLAP